MDASPGDLLFAEALLCAASVVEAYHVQDGATTGHVRRKVSVLWLPTSLLFVTFLFECKF